MSESLISLVEAAAKGIERVRRPCWSDSFDHLKIDITQEGQLGPWLHLYCPVNKSLNGRDPYDFVPSAVDIHQQWFEPYKGSLPESDEYKAAVANYTSEILALDLMRDDHEQSSET